MQPLDAIILDCSFAAEKRRLRKEQLKMSKVEKTSGVPSSSGPPKILSASKELAKANHPSTGTMVNAAIATLNESRGSSLPAIKKYITGTYLVDAEKNSAHIKKHLNTSLENKSIVQVKGRFKLAVKPDKEKPVGKAKASPVKSVVGKAKGPKVPSAAGKVKPESKKSAKAKAKKSPVVGKKPKPDKKPAPAKALKSAKK